MSTNRPIASATSGPELRRRIAGEIGARLSRSAGPACLLLPLRGVQAWDRPGEPLHDPIGLAAFIDATRQSIAPDRLIEVDAHINDDTFAMAALACFDRWLAEGRISMSRSGEGPIVNRPVLILDFGGVISRTLFETHSQSERALGLPAGSLTWQGPFAPHTDLLWRRMQAGELSERDYWRQRAREVGAMLGRAMDRHADAGDPSPRRGTDGGDPA